MISFLFEYLLRIFNTQGLVRDENTALVYATFLWKRCDPIPDVTRIQTSSGSIFRRRKEMPGKNCPPLDAFWAPTIPPTALRVCSPTLLSARSFSENSSISQSFHSYL